MSYDFHAELAKVGKIEDPLGLEFADWAIATSDKWRSGEIPDTPLDFVEAMDERLLSVCKRLQVPPERTQEIKDFFHEKNLNPATASLLFLVNAADSEFFPQYMRGAVTAQSFTMEIAYGRCEDLNGVLREVPETDPMYIDKEDLGNQYIRWRDEKAKNLMLGLKEGGKITCIAQGALPEIRYFSYPIDLLQRQSFICYDPAPIDLQQFFKVNIKGFIKQYRMGIETSLTQEALNLTTGTRRSDMYSIKGFLSYAVPALPKIIPAVVDLLAPGGVLGADIQLDGKIMNRNKRLFMWGSEEGMHFDMMRDPDDVKQQLGKIIESAQLPVTMQIDVSPGVDPVGVYVTMTKNT